jgi:methylthioribose-1-phosphate isomerase
MKPDALAAPAIPRGPLAALPATLEWVGGAAGFLRLLDQTRLPTEVVTRDCTTVEDVWQAIRTLQVRGAPALGVAAAYGLCLGARALRDLQQATFLDRVNEIARYLCGCRPTAVNLAWAIGRLVDVAASPPAGCAPWDAMLREAHRLAVEDAESCRRIGQHGAHLVPAGGGVLTHCNAGALATVAWGTALAPLYVAHARGKRFRVYADETRPLLQGARLTAFELSAVGIDVTVLCDGAAASLMQAGHIQLVVVGADRIAANGDTANKIGTCQLAIAARHFGIPFYVAAPCSTFDPKLHDGGQIPIEERAADEVRLVAERVIAPAAVSCYNPAFDVTPANLITGLITERGMVEPVSAGAIAQLLSKSPGVDLRAAPEGD